MSCDAVRARGLVKRFGAVDALRGIDLAIDAGRTCAILGPNGAGKSTLLRLLAGLARPSGGELAILGEKAQGARARGRVGFVGHATWIYAELTSRENLLFAARLHGLADAAERAERGLAELGLVELAERRAGALSRGLAQRLSIARALVHDPSLVLLDEPFTGLDRPAADRLIALLGQLRSHGRTLVIVTHASHHAAEVCDQALVLSRGRVIHEERAGEAGTVDLAPLERAVVAASESQR
ncbi:MAG: ABC transporter ATP-binding protein [Myxococcota bacterium]